MYGAKRNEKRIDLSDLFDHETYVVVKPLPHHARAEVNEYQQKLYTLNTDRLGKKVEVEMDPKSQYFMGILEAKLSKGVARHNIRETPEGEPVQWGKDVWEKLDEENPEIIERIVKGIDELTWPEKKKGAKEEKKESSGDPT